MEKIVVVVVEDVDVARSALRWALHNIVRCGDVLALVHVYPTSRNKNKHRRRRLKGFQLALSFRSDICSAFPNTKTEILVTEGDEDGRRIAAIATEIGASALVLGLHARSFLYRLISPENSFRSNFSNCKVLAIKEPTSCVSSTSIPIQESVTNMDFSQIEISMCSFPEEVPTPKIPYQICPDPAAIIWRSRSSRTMRNSG